MGRITQWISLIIAALVAGNLAQSLQLPAAWMVAPMVIAVGFALAKRNHVNMPPKVSVAAQSIIGTILASSFNPSVLPLLATNWLPVTIVSGGTLVMSLTAGFLLTRMSSMDPVTSALGTLPGGASGMIAMSTALGADTRLVALMQYVRLVLVVVSASLLARLVLAPLTGVVPHNPVSHIPIVYSWLDYVLTILISAIGTWAGMYFRLPAGALLGPLIIGAVLTGIGVFHIVWPPGVMQSAYAIIGVSVGLLFDMASLRQIRRLLPIVFASTLGLMLGCACLGWVLSFFTKTDPLTAYLATTPGGVDSVTVAALGSGANTSLVLAVQMLRLFVVVFAGPPLARRIANRRIRCGNPTLKQSDKNESSSVFPS